MQEVHNKSTHLKRHTSKRIHTYIHRDMCTQNIQQKVYRIRNILTNRMREREREREKKERNNKF